MESAAVLTEITRIVREVFPATKRVILFGSHSRGTATLQSDYDLLVVADTPLSPAERIVRLRLALLPVEAAFDLLVVTPAEFERLRAWTSSIVSQAAREGRVLHEAA